MTTVAKKAELPRRPRLRLSWVDSFLWAVRVAAVIIIVWGVFGSLRLTAAGEGLSGAAYRDLLVSGVAQGAMYGLIALGYSMVYGVLGFINFAHGEVFTAGSMVGFFFADAMAGGMWEDNFPLAIAVVFVVAMFTSTLVAVVVERVAYRPLRGAPRLIPLITSIGISFFLQYAFLGLFGAAVKNYPPLPEALTKRIEFLGLISIEGTKLLVIVLALISMAGLWLFVERTKTGRAMRAVAEDKEIAALMGIDVDRIIVTTFAVGGVMAGIAGVMWAMLFRGVSFITGFLPGIKAFTAAVLGGIGNIVGAMIGGLTLGIFESVGPQVVLGGLEWELNWPVLFGGMLLVLAVAMAVRPAARHHLVAQASLGILALALLITLIIPGLRDGGLSVDIPGLSQLKDVVAFTALVLVLIFKPTGLLGERLAVEERG